MKDNKEYVEDVQYHYREYLRKGRKKVRRVRNNQKAKDKIQSPTLKLCQTKIGKRQPTGHVSLTAISTILPLEVRFKLELIEFYCHEVQTIKTKKRFGFIINFAYQNL